MTAARWPAQECLHETTAPEQRLESWPGVLRKIVPELCIDCLSRRDPETGEWVPPEGGQS